MIHDFKNNLDMARKEGRMFRQKCHQVIKRGFVKTYSHFSTILIYKTTTTNITSFEI